MPMRTTACEVMERRESSHDYREGTSDQLLAGRDPNEVFAKDGLLDDLKKALSERILNAELDEHLEDDRTDGSANRRNGHSRKSVLTGTSKMTLSIPRDRAGTFDPKLIAKYQCRFPDFYNKIISMYARGMTVREIRGHLEELHGVDVSPDLISAVTDAVLEEVAEWQNRPLDAIYPLVFFACNPGQDQGRGLRAQQGRLHRARHPTDGTKQILGIWIEQTQSAKFWLRVFNDLKGRGVADVLIAVVDGLKGLPKTINAVLPQTVVQTCIVHRNPIRWSSCRGGIVSRSCRRCARFTGKGCRSRHEGPRGIRGRLLGPLVSGDHPELAAQLATPGTVSRLPRKSAPDHLHHG